ncbi:MAG: ADP-glyceromanno-heptose 6-epimerase [Pseudomonadota bacterium]
MILVTGGAGFIGSNLVAALEARGLTDIVVCDRLGREDKWRNIAKRELADLIHPKSLLDWLAKNGDVVEIIFHLGAVSATTERNADLIVRRNIRLPIDLWDHCAKTGTRFIYASSGATYGDGSAGFSDDATIDALARLLPLNAYGWSKHMFDRRVARLLTEGKETPPQWAGLKFFNVYGPNEYNKGDMRSVVNKLTPLIRAGEPARLFRSYHPDYEDGGQKRDFIWVDDCVDVMLWLYDNPSVDGLFNVGTGEARSWRDLAEAVFAALGKSPEIDFIDMPDGLREKYQNFTEAEMVKLRAAGYDRPFTSLEDGVRRYVQDYLTQPDPYR